MKKSILFLLCTTAILQLSAQVVLQFDTPGYSLAPHPNDTFSQTPHLISNGNKPYSDTIQFGKLINGVSVHNDSVIQINNDGGIWTFSAINHYSNAVQINGHALPQYLAPGGNLILIWPIYNGRLSGSHDTLTYHLHVVTTGIGEHLLVQIGILAHERQLSFLFGDLEKEVGQVSIYDITGRDFFRGDVHSSLHIDAAAWAVGLYICRVGLLDGSYRDIKLLIE